MEITKKILGFALSAVLAASLFPAAAFAQETGEAVAEAPTSRSADKSAESVSATVFPAAQSGLLHKAKPTAAQLKAAWLAMPAEPLGTKIFASASSLSPYKAGTLTANAQSYVKSLLNLYRTQAGLDPVSLTSGLNRSAAQGTLVNSYLGFTLSHFPPVPEGVSAAAAKPGRYAASTSNLALSWSTGNRSSVLGKAIGGWMDDADSYNAGMVGHRRWILNPGLKTTGIGASHRSLSGYHVYHTGLRVFNNAGSAMYDSSYAQVGGGSSRDYQYVAWPASGAMLSGLFSAGVPWSVSLNPDLYQDPKRSDVTVKVTRVSDGKAWTLSKNDSSSTTKGEFFQVNADGYGEGPVIIFNPGKANLGASKYKGAYTVKIRGLRTAEGESTSLTYRVNFCNPTVNLSDATVSDISARAYTGKRRIPAVTVKYGGKALKKGVHYKVSYKNNRNVGTATVTVTGIGKCTGKITKKFKINPPKTKLVSTKGAVGGFTVKWTKKTKQVSGYQIRWSTKANFSTYGTKSVAGCGKVSATVKGLSDAAYYVKVRTYKTVNGVKYYSGWTSAWKATTKHSHSWTAVTEDKWVVDKPAWSEEVYSHTLWHCSGCGAVFDTIDAQSVHAEEAMLDGNNACAGSWVEEVWETVHHEAQGHYETVTVGWKCPCGATK